MIAYSLIQFAGSKRCLANFSTSLH